MPTDISRSREGENRRSDQTSTRRVSSPKSGRIRDFATHQYQISEQQSNGKGPAPAERKNLRAIGEDGQPVEKQIMLSNRYDRDRPGLAGGNDHEASQHFKDTGELAASDWELLEAKLSRIEPAFYARLYVQGVATQEEKEKMDLNIANMIRNRETSTSNICRRVENELNGTLNAYNNALEYYKTSGGGDYQYLDALSQNGPKDGHAKNDFITSINNSFGDINSYKAHAYDNSEE